ncbi:GDSL-type esterase/lipase family protein [Aquabacter sp. CN5-332]|uniref:SGNH/GDSL hydrolase family protein n=1 Tax=Aquabacter sp. CN5-332 TaxID=3156608 RepID=UPI0032B36330
MSRFLRHSHTATLRALLGALLCVFAAMGPGAALAQDILRPPGNVPRPPANVPQGGLNLFGGWTLFKQQAPPPVQAPPAKRPPPEPEGAVYSGADEAAQGKKQPPAKFVLVMGDGLAAQLAQGLADIYVGDRSNPAIISRTDDDEGFLPPERPGGPDVMSRIPEAVSAARPNATILALGSNDLRPIKEGDLTVEPLTDRWIELYGKRVDEVLAALRAKAGGVIVVGTAPVQNPDTSAQYERLNDILRTHAARAGAAYVPVWDGFVDEDGKYAASGAAVDGQRRRLRNSDGVRFTKAGARKLAFFTQKDVTRLIAEPSREEVPAAAVGDGTKPAFSLTDGPRGANALAGATATPAAIPASVPLSETARFLTEGAPIPAVAGRADDHSWPPRPLQPPAPPQAATGPDAPAPSVPAAQ